jgi:hypothetical protein
MSPLPQSAPNTGEQESQLRHRIAKLRWMGLDSEADELAKRPHRDSALQLQLELQHND